MMIFFVLLFWFLVSKKEKADILERFRILTSTSDALIEVVLLGRFVDITIALSPIDKTG